MSDNIQTNTTGRLTLCLQQKIDKTRYLVEVHFSDTSTQCVEDKLKRVILHDLEHGKQGRPRKSDENDEDILESSNRQDSKTALFVIISDTDDTFNFVASILYTQLFNLLCDKADDEYGGRLEKCQKWAQKKETFC